MNTEIKNNWYEDFFAGLNCEMWERAVPAEWTKKEADFLVKTLNVNPGGEILDVPCGHGRHAIELAKLGYTIFGIDISIESVRKLRSQAAVLNLPIQVLLGNILTTETGRKFDGAYCLGNSFGYVDYDGMAVFVKNVSGGLKSGARFVINSGLVAESILPNFPKSGHYVLGDLVTDISNSYVIGESYMATQITHTKADRSETHYFKHYVYTLSEIKRLLKRFDLQTVAVYNSTEMTPYQLGDQQIYLVAEKL